MDGAGPEQRDSASTRGLRQPARQRRRALDVSPAHRLPGAWSATDWWPIS